VTGDELFNVFLAAAEEAQERMGVREEVSVWEDSPFRWMLMLPSRSRGKAGELLATAWLQRLGYDVKPPRGSGHDRIVEGIPTEIKFSTLWKSGDYVFQQLRDQDYTYVLLLGIRPDDASAWFTPKELAFGEAVPQHGGSSGRDTRWIRFRASSPPPWLDSYGGSLATCASVLERTFRGSAPA
jgi:hypothetical protein